MHPPPVAVSSRQAAKCDARVYSDRFACDPSDIICFSISVTATSGQTFSLTMACFALVAKPFLVPSLLVDMKSRGGGEFSQAI